MYCPKCKKDVKPGGEKKHIHERGLAGVVAGGSFFFLGAILSDGVWMGVGIGGAALGCVFGFAFLQTVCPACKKVLLPENPFSEP